MNEGDLILTPNWTWHEHSNNGNERVVWFDGLDVPLVYFYNAWFTEHGPVGNLPPDAGTVPDGAYANAGIAPDDGRAPTRYSPMFRYAWPAVCEAIAHLPAAEDGTRRLRYTNPISGGPVMPTMDLGLLDLPSGVETRPYRTMSNAIAVVAEGEGETHAGDRVYKWRKNDIFTLPHWSWISHKAASGTARMFLSTDRAVLDRLGLLREEWK
jgi:gentisate 1,2-dioxygenase